MPSNTLWTIVGILIVIVLLFIVIRLIIGADILAVPLPSFGELGWCEDCS